MGAAPSPATSKETAPKEAAPVRDMVLAVMMAHDEMRQRPDGAALLAVHVLAVLGPEEALTLPKEKLADYVRIFRASYPTAWPAALHGDSTAFVMHLGYYGQAKLKRELYEARAQELLAIHQKRNERAAAA